MKNERKIDSGALLNMAILMNLHIISVKCVKGGLMRADKKCSSYVKKCAVEEEKSTEYVEINACLPTMPYCKDW